MSKASRKMKGAGLKASLKASHMSNVTLEAMQSKGMKMSSKAYIK